MRPWRHEACRPFKRRVDALLPPADASDSVPPIKIAWLKKFEGDDMFHAEAVNQTQLPWSWGTAQVRAVAGHSKLCSLGGGNRRCGRG